MNKEQLFNELHKRIKITQDDFDKKYAESQEYFKKIYSTETPDEEQVLHQTYSKYKSLLNKKVDTYTGYCLGINYNNYKNSEVDFYKTEALANKQVDEKYAIQQKWVTKDGEPMWHEIQGKKLAKFKKGKVITDNDYSNIAVLLAKSSEDKKPVIYLLQLFGEQRHIQIPRFKFIEFVARKDRNNPHKLYAVDETKFVVKEDKEMDFVKIKDDFLTDNIMELHKMDSYYEKNKDNFDRIAIVKAKVDEVILSTNDTANTRVTLQTFTYDMDEDKQYTAWVDYREKINFSDGCPEIYVIGQPTVKKNERTDQVNYSIGVYGIWVPEKLRKAETEPVIEEKVKEKTVEW